MSSLFVFFAVAIVLSSLSIKFLLIQLSNFPCACAVLYSTDSPSSFSVCHFVRIFEVKGVRISEVLLYIHVDMVRSTVLYLSKGRSSSLALIEVFCMHKATTWTGLRIYLCVSGVYDTQRNKPKLEEIRCEPKALGRYRSAGGEHRHWRRFPCDSQVAHSNCML